MRLIVERLSKHGLFLLPQVSIIAHFAIQITHCWSSSPMSFYLLLDNEDDRLILFFV